jgi:hypothetical protein
VKRRAALASIALVAAAAAAGAPASRASAASAGDLAALGLQPYEPPKAAPAFALPDLEGRVRRLEDYRGKALLLFFWATW